MDTTVYADCYDDAQLLLDMGEEFSVPAEFTDDALPGEFTDDEFTAFDVPELIDEFTDDIIRETVVKRATAEAIMRARRFGGRHGAEFTDEFADEFAAFDVPEFIIDFDVTEHVPAEFLTRWYDAEEQYIRDMCEALSMPGAVVDGIIRESHTAHPAGMARMAIASKLFESAVNRFVVWSHVPRPLLRGMFRWSPRRLQRSGRVAARRSSTRRVNKRTTASGDDPPSPGDGDRSWCWPQHGNDVARSGNLIVIGGAR